uniref:Uncharacterized protein n=1 Tax=viral metagenome TaxID=1070528 RepID=A0A6M3XV20_9ZZZZ
MEKSIKWTSAGPNERKAVVELCGWRNRTGNATPMGKRIASTPWEKLSPAAKQVLTNHGILA